eukprot:350545-Chlamydomonas_euryale.AAC.5
MGLRRHQAGPSNFHTGRGGEFGAPPSRSHTPRAIEERGCAWETDPGRRVLSSPAVATRPASPPVARGGGRKLRPGSARRTLTAHGSRLVAVVASPEAHLQPPRVAFPEEGLLKGGVVQGVVQRVLQGERGGGCLRYITTSLEAQPPPAEWGLLHWAGALGWSWAACGLEAPSRGTPCPHSFREGRRGSAVVFMPL